MGAAVAGQGLDGRELAHVQIQPGRPVAALQPAFDKGRQPLQHGFACGMGHFGSGLVGGGQQVSGQPVAAARAVFGARGVVAGQAVGIQIGGQAVGHCSPLRRILQTEGLAGALLQAVVGVGLKIAAQAGQCAAQARLQRHQQATRLGPLRRQRVWRRFEAQADGRIQLLQRGLQHSHGHGLLHQLQHLQAVFGHRPGSCRGWRNRPALPAQLVDSRFPRDAESALGHAQRPGHFPGAAGGQEQVLRRQRQRFAVDGSARPAVDDADQRGAHFHVARGGVAQRQQRLQLVAFAHQRRQAGQHLQVLRDADAGAAAAEGVPTGIGDGAVGHRHQAKAGERVVQRHLHRSLPVGVQHHRGLPQQQGVEQLARAAAATAAAGGHGLAAVMTAADDLALSSAGFDAPGALLQHGAQQVPGRVATQRQQAFVHCSKGHLGTSGRFAVLRDGDARGGLLTDGVLRPVGGHPHLQFVRRQANLQCRHTQFEGRFREVHHRRRCLVCAAFDPETARPIDGLLPAPGEERLPLHLAYAATHGEHADVDIGAPGLVDGQLDGGVAAAQRDDAGVDDALAFHRHQRGGFAERHAHLQPRGFAGFVALLFRQHVDAVVVVLGKPQLALLRHPHAGHRLRGVAAAVPGLGDQLDLAGGRQLGIAIQQAAAVGLAAAQDAQVLQLGAVVVGVKTAHHALARADGGGQAAAYFDRLPLEGAARGVECQRGEARLAALAGPRGGADAHHHRAGPQRHGGGHRLQLAVGVVEGDLGQQFAGLRDGGQTGQRPACGAVDVGAERLLVGHQYTQARAGLFGAIDLRCLGLGAARAWRLEAEIFIACPARRTRAQQGGAAQRRMRHGAARQVTHLHAQGQFRGCHKRFFGWHHPCIHQRHTERFDAEVAAVPCALFPGVCGLALQHDAVTAELGGRRNVPAGAGAAHAGPLQRLREFLATAFVHQLHLVGQLPG